MNLSEIGVIGMGVMGSNLALNLADNKFEVSVYNRPHKDKDTVGDFIRRNANFKNLRGFDDLKAFVQSLERPRKIIIMVKAGAAVDQVIDELAGLVEKGEAALAAAQRELMEETGIRGTFTELGNVCPNNAFMSNRQSFFLVTDLEKVSGQSLDPNETIDVIEVPVEDVIRDMGTGLYDNGIMMMAIGFFLRYAESHPELRSAE